jgi:uncharacterized membrane protein YkvA (DUF1232 family)
MMIKNILDCFKTWAANLKQQLIILHLAYSDKGTPWYAKALIVFIIAYALSPIDLIPDFIPVIGYLDDLILLPIGIYFALKLIPKEVIENAKVKGQEYKWNKKRSLVGGILVALIWLGFTLFLFLKFSSKPHIK